VKISIITVAFNSASTIRDTIESVLSQTNNDIEYIIVDGKSNDNTVEIIKSYESMFNGRLHWISEPDKGLYDAMNKGIQMATGDIIGIINSDDFYHRNDIIEKIAEVFVKDDTIQATFGDVRFVNSTNLEKTVRYYRSKNFNIKRFRFGFMPPHPTFFTYKRNFEKYGLYQTNYKIAADYELLIRFIYTHKLKYKYLPLDVMKMRMGGASTASLRSNLILNQEIIRACKENGIYTNMPVLMMKYIVKIWELIFTN
jgi:glycosyltransferase involved in cell wall biosynthesis